MTIMEIKLDIAVLDYLVGQIIMITMAIRQDTAITDFWDGTIMMIEFTFEKKKEAEPCFLWYLTPILSNF